MWIEIQGKLINLDNISVIDRDENNDGFMETTWQLILDAIIYFDYNTNSTNSYKIMWSLNIL